MHKTTLKADSHGLYVKAGGYLFRPVPTPRYAAQAEAGEAAPGGYVYPRGESRLAEGERVTVHHIKQTGLVQVRGTVKELWYAHGEHSVDTGAREVSRPTDEVWSPREAEGPEPGG